MESQLRDTLHDLFLEYSEEEQIEQLDKALRLAGYETPESCKKCQQRQMDNEKILIREAAFDEAQLRDEVEYWKQKDYQID